MPTAACAWRWRAAAAASVKLPASIRSTSAFSSASAKSSHHFPRAISSLGCASFHPGGASLNAGDSGADGLSYSGPTAHPASSTTATNRDRGQLPNSVQNPLRLMVISIRDR
jgi:hypothetical protein